MIENTVYYSNPKNNYDFQEKSRIPINLTMESKSNLNFKKLKVCKFNLIFKNFFIYWLKFQTKLLIYGIIYVIFGIGFILLFSLLGGLCEIYFVTLGAPCILIG